MAVARRPPVLFAQHESKPMTDLQHDAVGVAVQALLNPRTVAVVGASDSSLFSRRILNNLERHGYDGEIFLVNPRRSHVGGRQCHPTIGSVPQRVELALVMVGAEHVVSALRECAEAGVIVASVAASGFAEAGDQGRVRQAEVAAIARDTGMRIIGPNCMGVVVQETGLVATFSQAVEADLLPGRGAAYAGQSGALGGAILGLCRERGVGLSAWCTAGNEVDLTSVNVARGMVERPDILTVALYLESVPDGRDWTDLLNAAAARGKQVVLLRSGRSQAGQRAAASHTGAMVRADVAFELLNQQRGVITVDDVAALIDVLEALEFQRTRPGARVGVVTSSGGLGTMMADGLELTGLQLAELTPTTRDDISKLIPEYGSTENPIDVTAQLFNGDGQGFEHVCASMLADANVDALAILLTTIVDEAATALAASIAHAVGAADKHAFVVWVAPEDQTQEARKVLRAAGIPTGTAIRPQLDLVNNLNARLSRPTEDTAVPTSSVGTAEAIAFVTGRTGTLTEADGVAVLDALAISRPRGQLVDSAQAATVAAAHIAGIGGTVVMKIQSPDILHKSDIGGVAVGVPVDEVAHAYADILRAGESVDANIHGVLIQEVADPGRELILSASGSKDGYPPVITIGFGGVNAELTRDFASGLAPLHADTALKLLQRLRGWPLLQGYRGAPATDVSALVAAMCALSQFAVDADGRLVELEINPLRAGPDQVTALDLVIELRSEPAPD